MKIKWKFFTHNHIPVIMIIGAVKIEKGATTEGRPLRISLSGDLDDLAGED